MTKHRWLKRDCCFIVRIVYPKKALQQLQYVSARVVEISEGEAVIQTAFSRLPDHFYIVLGHFEHHIGASVVRREGNEIEVEFLKEQQPKLINILARIEAPLSTIHPMGVILENLTG